MNEEMNINELYLIYPELLDILLKDNSTKKNIIWAIDHYKKKEWDIH